MTMMLYLDPASTNCMKVLMTAAELGVTLELTEVALARGEQRRPDYLKLNPNGQVPTLVDGDFTLTESHAIMQYLAETAPDGALRPAAPEARAEVARWLFWCSSQFGPAVRPFQWERLVKPLLGMGSPDAEALAEADGQFRRAASVLDAHLAGRDFVAGPGLSLADIALAATLAYAEPACIPVDDFPAIQHWRSGIARRPSWAAAQPAKPLG